MNVSKLTLACGLAMAATHVCAEDSGGIEEVIVIGQKIERSLQDTMESVAVITSEDIRRRGLQTLEDVYNQTANAFDLGNNEGFGIRGVTNNSGSTGGGNGELATYFIDGVAVTGFGKRFVPMDMWDVAQVEILRGPQSTNLGRNAMMGAVIVSSEQPRLGEFDASLLGGFGSEDRIEAAGMINLPIGERAAFRLSAEHLSTDGFITNATRGEDDFDARDNQTIRAKLYIEPTDHLRVLASFQYVESERGQNLQRADLADDLEDREAFGSIEDQEDLEATLATLDISYSINDEWTLRSITSRFDADYSRIDDDDGGPEGGDAFRGREANDKNWAEELRLDYESDRLKGTVGVYYTEVEVENITLGLVNINPALVGVPDILLPFYPPVVQIDVNSPFFGDTENTAIFTEWEYRFSDEWTIVAGLRYEEEDQDNDSRVANTLNPSTPLPDPVEAGQIAAGLFGPAFGPVVEAGVSQVNQILLTQLTPSSEVTRPDFDVTLGKVGLTYDLNDSAKLGFIFSQGYRAGGADLSLTGTLSEYDPEYLNNYELSYRSTLFDGTATLNANLYYGAWDDQQVTIGLNGNIFDTVLENAGDSTIYGGELELKATPSDDFTYYLTLGYSQTEFDDYISDIDGDLSGNEFAFSPEWSAAIGGTYYFGNFYVGASLSYQSEMWADVQNTIELDRRTLLGVQAGYQAENYEVSLYGKNLTDDEYLTTDAPGLAPGTRVVKLGDPREYGLQFTYHFN